LNLLTCVLISVTDPETTLVIGQYRCKHTQVRLSLTSGCYRGEMAAIILLWFGHWFC